MARRLFGQNSLSTTLDARSSCERGLKITIIELRVQFLKVFFFKFLLFFFSLTYLAFVCFFFHFSFSYVVVVVFLTKILGLGSF